MLMMERFGWSWQQLNDTPAEVIDRILVMWSVESELQNMKAGRGRPDGNL